MKKPKLHFVLAHVFISLILTATLPARAASYVWTNTAGGNWNVAANWSPNQVPGGSDSAAITTTGNYTVTNNSTESIGTLTLGASSGDGTVQTLTISSSTLTVNSASTGTTQGTLNITGGTLAGAGILTLAGPLNWTGGSIDLTAQFNGGTISQVNGLDGGSLINTGTLALTPYLYSGGGSVISNAASGTINVALNNQYIVYPNYGSPATFYNAGQINVSGAGYSGQLDNNFINTGTVSVNSGTLNLNGGGTNTGVFEVSAAATLEFGANYTLSVASSVTGAGSVNFNSGTVNSSGTYNINGTNFFAGATVAFSGNYTMTNQALVLSSGTVTFNAGGNMNLTNLTITGGNLYSSFPLLVNGPLNWTGGAIYGSVQFVGGTITEVNGLVGGTLINTGTLALNPYLYSGGGSVISNAASGIINVALNNQYIVYPNYGSPATFYNAGQINVSGAGYSGQMDNTFINTGTVSVNSGTLNLNGGGTNLGAIDVSSGATLEFGANYTLSASSSVTGAGSVNFDSGTVSFSGTYNVTGTNSFTGATVTFSGNYTITNQPLVLSSGTVSFNAGGNISLTGLTITGGSLYSSFPVLDSGPLDWSGGTIYGMVQFNGGSIGQVNGLQGGTLINTGTLAWTPYVYDGAGSVISNAASGIINITLNNSPITYPNYGSPLAFYNAGQINISGAGYAGNLDDNLTNTGTISVNSGTFNLNGGGTSTGTITVAANATLQIGGGTFNFNTGSIVSGAGNFTVNGGTANIGGTFGVAGTNNFANGTANITGAYSLTNVLLVSGGTVNFNGTLPLTPASVIITSGQLGGSERVQDSGPLNWSGGGVTGVIAFVGGSIGQVSGLQGGTLINTGTLAWTPYVYDGEGSVISNAANGIINITLNNSPITYPNYGSLETFYNAGQINVTGTGYSGNLNDNFINTGTVSVNSGTLNLNGGATSTGTITVATNATLLVSSAVAVNSGGIISGAGIFQVNSGAANFSGSYSITNGVILDGGTTTFNGSGIVKLAGLNLENGTLAGSNPVTVNGLFTWTGGTATGTLLINGGNISQVNGLNGGTLINTGTLSLSPYIYDGNGSVISNAASGIMNIALNNSPITYPNYGSPVTFYNAGEINVSGTGFAGNINDNFINTGTVAVNSGTLELLGGGTNTGVIMVATNATLQVVNTYNFTGGSLISGAGILKVTGGTANFTGAYTLTNPVVVTGGTASFTGNGTVDLASLTLSGGTMAGSNTVLVSGPFNWTGGTVTDVISFNGGSINQVNGLNGGTLINNGTLALTPYLYDGNGSIISNTASGIINVTLNNSPITYVNYGAPATFYNAGQINVSGTGFSGSIGDNFLNTGVVTLTSGNFDLAGGGTNTGVIMVGANATLQVGATYNFNGGAVISGAGGLKVTGGTANFTGAYSITNALIVTGGTASFNGSGSVNLASLTLSGGTMAGSNPVLVSGALNWMGGTITDVISFNGGTISQVYGLNGGTLINTGTLALTPYLYDGNGSIISNAASGIINVALNNSQITDDEYGGTATFYNAGQINVSGAGFSGSIGDSFTNTGTITVNSGTVSFTGSYSLTNGVLDFGLDSAANFGKVSLAGNPAALAGTIGAILNSNYVPLIGAAFPVINFTSSAGEFANTNLPPLAVWQTAYNPANVTISLLKYVPQLTWTNPASIVYGTALSGAQLDATAASPTNLSGTLAGTFNYTPALGTILDSGSNQILSVMFVPTDSADYTNVSTNVIINIQQAPLTITATNRTKTYGQTETFAGTEFVPNGLVNGDTVTSASLASAGDSPTAPVSGSPYTITITNAVGDAGLTNYIITYDTGTLTVNPAPLTITANAENKTYGQTVNFGSGSTLFTPVGLQNGETIGSVTLVVSGSGGAPAAPVAGSPYTITPSAATGGTFNPGNYAITYDTGSLTISKAPLTVTANAQSKTYGQTLTFGSGSTLFIPVGLQNGETIGSVTLTVSGNGGAPTASVAGSPYTITPSAATGGTFTASNYAITYDTGNLTVTKASLTVTANAQSKTYGQTLTFGSGSTLFTPIGLQNGETIGSVTLVVSGNGGAATASVAGSPYTITPSAATGGTFTAGDYAITYDTGNLTVSKAPLTVTANAQSKTYGQTVNFGSGSTLFTPVGLQNGETIGTVTLAVSGNGGAATASVAGSPYTITPSAATGGTFTAGNYAITYDTGNLTVITAPLTITANNRSKTFGQLVTFAGTEFTPLGLLNGDTVTSVILISSGAAANASVAGSPYNIVPSAAVGSGVGNYAITYDDGLLTVTLPSLNIVASSPNLILSWTTNASAFVLNQTASLNSPIAWTPITSGITIDGTSNTITINASSGNKFYELIAPQNP